MIQRGRLAGPRGENKQKKKKAVSGNNKHQEEEEEEENSGREAHESHQGMKQVALRKQTSVVHTCSSEWASSGEANL